MPLPDDILAIDFETTGAHKNNENIPWQLGAIRLVDGKIVHQHRLSLLLHVPENHRFNAYAPGRWASIREQLVQAPDFLHLWPQLQPWLQNRILMAHHVPTERGIIQRYFPFHPFGPWIDTLTLAQQAYPTLENYKLEYLIPTLGLAEQVNQLAPDLQPHDAYYDACACAVLYTHIRTLPGWDKIPLEHLMVPR